MKIWLYLIAGAVLTGCREPIPFQEEDADTHSHFYIKMPDFMAPWPEKDDVAEFHWGWNSIDETIEVVCSGSTMPKKTLKSPVALNEEVKRKWIWLLTKEPSFKKTGENRYQSLAKGANHWEVIIAEENDENWFLIKVFVICSRAGSTSNPSPPLQIPKAEAILASLESGRYVNQETYLELMGGRPPKEERLVIHLLRGGDIIYNGKKITLLEFTDISRDAVDKNPKTRLHLRAHKKSNTENIKAVVRAAAKGGLEDVIFGALVKD